MEGYGRRLSELVLRGMDSEVLGCRVSSTVVCVEVRRWVWRRDGLGKVVGDPALLGGLSQGQVPRPCGTSESRGQVSVLHLCARSLIHSFFT